MRYANSHARSPRKRVPPKGRMLLIDFFNEKRESVYAGGEIQSARISTL